ncbi:simple sugar transport system substrate-binding protein/ribose transport system substrate-binding protein [Inhella inkyongensis]|uniref:Simple sugar transport system substrate-binding protein/ribose transport system substrate-binding protein n=1 Tax=Inhella inkyongensis TaxID=392593 RepID=A0A840RXR6_9BURK|nr:substrate-binding domain-containing protein [Inhella inkyongensis]MBB5203497.1 simple sugar transport system substrate-binding protein/ribose transport system substrate-binding protein [Inhella inkyongensis]
MNCLPLSLNRRQAGALLAVAWSGRVTAAERRIVYLSAKQDLPFWSTVGRGVRSVALAQGFGFVELDSQLKAEVQLENARRAIQDKAAGLVISPVDSQSAPAVLDLARKAKVPVVIADIGTTAGDYATYVKSDNYRGAFDTGSALAQALKDRGWQQAPHALITISLARKNGQDRTNGFRDAFKEAGLGKEVALRQMQDYSAAETQRYVAELLAQHPQLRALFIQTDQPVAGALQALKAAGRSGEVLIASFDAMPEVEALLTHGTLVAVGMQQPHLMGQRAAEALLSALRGERPPKQVLVPIMVGTGKNISNLMPQVNKQVFGR